MGDSTSEGQDSAGDDIEGRKRGGDGQVAKEVDGVDEIDQRHKQDGQPAETEGGAIKQEEIEVDEIDDNDDVEITAVEQNVVKEEEASQEIDYSALGSAEDIAAAAMEAANISSLFGSTAADHDTRGTKRSHEDMASSEVNGVATDHTINAPTTLSSSAYIPPATAAPSSVPPSSIASTSLPTQAPIQYTSTSSLISNEGQSADTAFLGNVDLESIAQAAMGLDAEGNPLPGNEESHRALADAVKQLSAAQSVTMHHPNYPNRSGDESSDNGGPAKRFQCTQCERAFARAYNLNTHLATHDPDPSRSKPFPCPYPSCKTDGGRSFSRKHDLQRHVASTHENEPEPITSTIGENGVRQTGALASLGLGTPGRKFRCDDCGRAFVRRDALKRHQCTKIMETSSTQSLSRSAQDYYSNNLAGLSLYTSNAPSSSTQPSQSQQHQPSSAAKATNSAESSYESDPFGANGLTYETLSKEVQDMAMQLVAQAQSYNGQQTESSSTEKTAEVPSNPTSQAAATTSAASSSQPAALPSSQRPNLVAAPAAPVVNAVKAEQVPSSSPSSSTTATAIIPSSAPTPTTSHAPAADPISAQ
jgi:transposase-like protein